MAEARKWQPLPVRRKSRLLGRSIFVGTDAQECELDSSQGVPESAAEQSLFGTPSLGLLPHTPVLGIQCALVGIGQSY